MSPTAAPTRQPRNGDEARATGAVDRSRTNNAAQTTLRLVTPEDSPPSDTFLHERVGARPHGALTSLHHRNPRLVLERYRDATVAGPSPRSQCRMVDSPLRDSVVALTQFF